MKCYVAVTGTTDEATAAGGRSCCLRSLVMNALLAGEVQMSLMALGGLGGQLKAGKVKLLVVSSAKRLPQFPDVPTYAEAGLEGAPRTWWALLSPAGTPDAMVKRVNAEFVKLFNEPKLRRSARPRSSPRS